MGEAKEVERSKTACRQAARRARAGARGNSKVSGLSPVPPARDGRPKRTSRVFSVLIFSPKRANRFAITLWTL
jgi:hypothetical protein